MPSVVEPEKTRKPVDLEAQRRIMGYGSNSLGRFLGPAVAMHILFMLVVMLVVTLGGYYHCGAVLIIPVIPFTSSIADFYLAHDDWRPMVLRHVVVARRVVIAPNPDRACNCLVQVDLKK